MYNPYEILGLHSNATMDEVDASYRQMRDKYYSKRYALGAEGEEAAEKLSQIELAYTDILNDIRFQNDEKRRLEEDSASAQSNTYVDGAYLDIEELIKQGNFEQAQALLDDVNNRDAEWHYIQSIIYYSKNWFLESKKQLEMAVSMQPNNTKYIESLAKLNKIIASNRISPDQMRTTSRPTGSSAGPRGNNTCTGSCCGDLCLADCCCECMGGDCIPCC